MFTVILLLGCGSASKPPATAVHTADTAVESTGPDCTITPQNEWLYTADWTGVTAFVDDICVWCHGPEGVPGWSLIETIELQLAGEDTQMNTIVEPGDPESSFLWRTIDGLPNTALMPYNAPTSLPCEHRAHIYAWILAGAPI